jgi:hypothetical protein
MPDWFLSHLNNYWNWDLALLLVLSMLGFLFWHPACKHLGRFSLSGMILLQKSPSWQPEMVDVGSEVQFREQLQKFQAHYAPFQIQLELSQESLRLEIQTPKPLWVHRGGIAERLQEQVQNLLDCLPPEKYFIQTHLQGRIESLKHIQNFVLLNQERRIGLQISENPRLQVKGLFFHG